MANHKFKDVAKRSHDQLWIFTLASVLLLALIVFLGLWNTNWDFNVILPGYGVWTKDTVAGVDIWYHLRIIDGVKVTADTPRAVYDIGILAKSLLVQTLAFILYFNERTRNILKKAMDLSYIVTVKVIGKFKSLQADEEFRSMVFDLDLKEKKDTWKLLTGLKLEKHLNKETTKMSYERMAIKKDPTLQPSPKLAKFMRIEAELREKLTDEWINEHIMHINFTYPKITVRMILTGNTSVRISRMAIEDVKAAKGRETRFRLLSIGISLGWVILFGSITSLTFRYNIWKAVLDTLIYSFPVVTAFVYAILSANKIHESKENELQDRLGYITKYVTVPVVKETRKEVIEEISEKTEINRLKKQMEIKTLEEKLNQIKKEDD